MNLCAKVCMCMYACVDVCVSLRVVHTNRSDDRILHFKMFCIKTRVKKDLWSSACSYVFAYVYAFLLFFVFGDALKMHLE